MKVVIYARVSTAIQDYKRQTEELTSYAEKMHWQVVKTFEEKISGVQQKMGLKSLIPIIPKDQLLKYL